MPPGAPSHTMFITLFSGWRRRRRRLAVSGHGGLVDLLSLGSLRTSVNLNSHLRPHLIVTNGISVSASQAANEDGQRKMLYCPRLAWPSIL